MSVKEVTMVIENEREKRTKDEKAELNKGKVRNKS